MLKHEDRLKIDLPSPQSNTGRRQAVKFLWKAVVGCILILVALNFTVLATGSLDKKDAIFSMSRAALWLRRCSTNNNNDKNHIERLPFCFENSSTIPLVDEGDWEPISGLTRMHYRARAELDRFIRRTNDWAPVLQRKDLRCGKEVPLPGYRLFAQCDPDSQFPCCNPNTGLCGNQAQDCQCDNCTDFRKMVSAELATWRPKKCQLREYTWQESCSMLFRNNVSLHFIGDSLIRHLHTATFLHLTNDYETGAIPQNTSDTERQRCSGVLQIVKKECSIEVTAQNSDELAPGAMCPGVAPDFIEIDLIQDYHKTLLPKVREKIKSLLNRPNSWIIIGVGLHYQLNFDLLRREYLDKVVEILRQSTNGWPRMMWIGNHAYSGFVRQLSGPNMESIKTFNSKVNKYLQRHGIEMLRTFEMSRNVRSYDGRHHGLGLNLLKTNLMLNYVGQFYDSK